MFNFLIVIKAQEEKFKAEVAGLKEVNVKDTNLYFFKKYILLKIF